MKGRQLYSISLHDLKKIIEKAENRAQYGSMEGKLTFEVTGNDNLSIYQLCDYHDCNPIYHTELKNEA